MITDGLFTDGGLASKNPSSIGGAWAWCFIKSGWFIRTGSGILTPADCDTTTVSNNDLELIAAIRALEGVGNDYDGVLWTDSYITLRRLINPKAPLKGLSLWLKERLRRIQRGRKLNVKLLGGHPSLEELRNGCRKNGRPVSRFNQWCDDECNRLIELHFAKETTDV